MSLTIVFLLIGGLVVGGVAWYYVHDRKIREQRRKYKAKIQKSDELVEQKLQQAQVKYEQKVKESEIKARRIIEWAEKDLEKRQDKLDQMESRIIKKEERLDEKIELLEKEKESLQQRNQSQKQQRERKNQETEWLIEQQKKKLSEIAHLKPEDAKAELMNLIEAESQSEILEFVEKSKVIIKEEADKEAQHIISRVLPRIAMNSVAEFTVAMIDIPSEDYKGKLIWREWRNVWFFEKTTGVELLIDDTPLVVKLSSHDHEKRFIAVETLKKLIKDWRINPVYIEKIYTEVLNTMDQLFVEKGKEALSILNIPMMKPEVVKMVWQFRLRYSYGQNLWIHSIEVAKLSESLAVEMGIDAMVAKKAWLLHDIGKIVASNGESHTKVWADVLRKFGFDDVVVNAAESHHYDVPMTNIISWIVTAADTLSASRPGARFETKDFFIEKMSELEKLILTVPWVDKVHIMQAGREIMVAINPKQIDDLWVEKLLKDIGIKVESQLDYPWIIRCVWVRETKLIHYLR